MKRHIQRLRVSPRLLPRIEPMEDRSAPTDLFGPIANLLGANLLMGPGSALETPPAVIAAPRSLPATPHAFAVTSLPDAPPRERGATRPAPPRPAGPRGGSPTSIRSLSCSPTPSVTPRHSRWRRWRRRRHAARRPLPHRRRRKSRGGVGPRAGDVGLGARQLLHTTPGHPFPQARRRVFEPAG
ncbi:MAG: hypothetical protein U0793_28285 [Gemmataceae bacterium]